MYLSLKLNPDPTASTNSQTRPSNAGSESRPDADSSKISGYSSPSFKYLNRSFSTTSLKLLGNTILLLKFMPILLSGVTLFSLTLGSCTLPNI